jgi:galactokinase
VREALVGIDDPEFGRGYLEARFDQFIQESEVLVPEAAAAVARGDLDALGALAAESQAAAERGLGNQVPETSELVRLARDHGAAAASAFGAGFGGSVWALVEAARAKMFARDWSAAYARAFPGPGARAAFLTTSPGPAACRLE